MGRFQPGSLVSQATLITLLHLLFTEVHDLYAWFSQKRDKASSYTRWLTLCSHLGNIYEQSICTIPELSINIPPPIFTGEEIEANKFESFTKQVNGGEKWSLAPAESSKKHHGICLTPLPTFSSSSFPAPTPPHSSTPATQAYFLFFPGLCSSTLSTFSFSFSILSSFVYQLNCYSFRPAFSDHLKPAQVPVLGAPHIYQSHQGFVCVIIYGVSSFH